MRQIKVTHRLHHDLSVADPKINPSGAHRVGAHLLSLEGVVHGLGLPSSKGSRERALLLHSVKIAPYGETATKGESSRQHFIKCLLGGCNIAGQPVKRYQEQLGHSSFLKSVSECRDCARASHGTQPATLMVAPGSGISRPLPGALPVWNRLEIPLEIQTPVFGLLILDVKARRSESSTPACHLR